MWGDSMGRCGEISSRPHLAHQAYRLARARARVRAAPGASGVSFG